MENKEGKKSKIKVSPEQIEKAAEAMGKTANAVDNMWSSFKDGMGPLGKALGFGVIVTLILALIHSPGLIIVLALMVAIGAAPMIHKKSLEFKAAAEARSAKEAAKKAAAAAEAPKDPKA
jgi:hypothetical protein